MIYDRADRDIFFLIYSKNILLYIYNFSFMHFPCFVNKFFTTSTIFQQKARELNHAFEEQLRKYVYEVLQLLKF